MNGFRDIITELCTALNLSEPAFSGRSATIEYADNAITISDNDNGLTFSALAGTLPTNSPDREDKTRKLLQGSLSILRSHSILICVKTLQGRTHAATELNISKSEVSISKLKSGLDDFNLITEAVKDILADNARHNQNLFELSNPVSDFDEMEFVFRP